MAAEIQISNELGHQGVCAAIAGFTFAFLLFFGYHDWGWWWLSRSGDDWGWWNLCIPHEISRCLSLKAWKCVWRRMLYHLSIFITWILRLIRIGRLGHLIVWLKISGRIFVLEVHGWRRRWWSTVVLASLAYGTLSWWRSIATISIAIEALASTAARIAASFWWSRWRTSSSIVIKVSLESAALESDFIKYVLIELMNQKLIRNSNQGVLLQHFIWNEYLPSSKSSFRTEVAARTATPSSIWSVTWRRPRAWTLRTGARTWSTLRFYITSIRWVSWRRPFSYKLMTNDI